MAAPTVIKWTDPGAPILSRVASSFIGVLDYCLPQRGWEKVFSGTDKAVYRSGSGERKFYRVLNDGSFYYNNSANAYCYAKITAYDSMSNVDTGAGQWGEKYFPVSAIGTAVTRPWMCIFDERTVFFISIPDKTTGLTLATSNSMVCGFGETTPALPGNTSRNFLAGNLLSNSPTSNYCAITCPAGSGGSYGTIAVNRSLDGTRLAIGAGLVTNGGLCGVSHYSSNSHYPFGVSDMTTIAYPYNGALLYGRPMLDDGIQWGMGDFIRGLYYPCHQGDSFNNWGTYTEGTLTFMAVRIVTMGSALSVTSRSYIGALLIQTGGDW